MQPLLECGEVFRQPEHGQRSICSDECRRTRQRRQSRESARRRWARGVRPKRSSRKRAPSKQRVSHLRERPEKTGKRTCAWCDIEFVGKWKTNPPTLCSEACDRARRAEKALKRWRANRDGKPPLNTTKREQRKCVICGAGFIAEWKQGVGPNKCGDACHGAARTIASRRSYKRDRPLRRSGHEYDDSGVPIKTTTQECVECENSFTVTWTRRPRTTCGDECANRRRSRASARRAAERRQLLASATIEDVDPYAVFERDDWRCYLCGRKVVASVVYRPDRATVDHVVPIAKGGAHSYDNVRTACNRCNSRKNARDLDEMRGQA